jgi:DNA ligase (NAD+)
LQEIIIPTHCPYCQTVLDIVKDQLFCRNASCPARSSKRVEHFAKTLKIKGLGPASIEKLGLEDIWDIYTLTQEEISQLLNSERLGEKLFAEIEKSKSADLTTLLPAFSIPLIGSSASNKLTKQVSSISEITYTKCIDSGLGPKAASNLTNFLEEEFYPMEYNELPFSFTCEIPKVTHRIKGVVCITGKLKSYPTKAAAEKVLQKYGFETKANLTKQVTILLNESGIESAKTNKAQEMGITIYNNIKTLLREN